MGHPVARARCPVEQALPPDRTVQALVQGGLVLSVGAALGIPKLLKGSRNYSTRTKVFTRDKKKRVFVIRSALPPHLSTIIILYYAPH